MASTTQDQSMLIGRFQLETLVGGSEHSQVWRARDVELERTVAIKLTHLPNEDARGRFKQEALLLARLAHPNLLQLYSFGEVGDGRAYMALEWIDNGRSSQMS